MTITLSSLSAGQLRRAAALKDRIAQLEKQLDQVLGLRAAPAAASAAKPTGRWKRRKMSAAARKRMSALTKARWKKIKAAGRKRL